LEEQAGGQVVVIAIGNRRSICRRSFRITRGTKMGTPKPTIGGGSADDGEQVLRIACPSCQRIIVFSGPRPHFCGFCGKPLPESLPLDAAALAPTEHEAVTRTPLTTPAADAAPELTEIGGYHLLRLLGGGGMGSVYEAEEPTSGRHVAVKLIAPGQELSADAVERFRREGRLASALSHPRCVFVYAADEDAGRPYIVMELMPGQTLADLVTERGPLPPSEAVEKILDVLDGLREAHRLGMVHRDVKPSNCFLEKDGRVKVGDFGLSKSLAVDARLTKSGSFLGTPLYASPEQIRGETLGPQSDVYSLAATLYFLLTGRAPFEGGDAAATLARIVSDRAPPMRALRPAVPGGLDRAVLRGLERELSRRWRSLDEFREALLPFRPAGQVAAGPGVRFAAWLADFIVCVPIGWSVYALYALVRGWNYFDFDPVTAERRLPEQILLGSLVTLCYFVFSEWWWGCTPGKRLLRLRVCTTGDVEPPGLARAFVRYAVFWLLTNVATLLDIAISAYLPTHALGRSADSQEALVENAMRSLVLVLALRIGSLLLRILGIGLMVSTMRRRNGWRGLHEFASGTRVIQLPGIAKRIRVSAGRADALYLAEGIPEEIGPFVVAGALRWDDAVRILAAEDRTLGRAVLISLRPAADPPLSQLRRDCARATRLRWLASGEHAAWRWDAFPAPTGRCLPELVNDEGPLTWTEVRPILEQLADEVVAAAGDGTLPDELTPDQVWVDSSGNVTLLDLSSRRQTNAEYSAGEPSLALLTRCALLALEGKPRAAARRIRAPIPRHAAEMLGAALVAPPTFHSATNLRAALEETRDRPTEVTRARRATHVALLVALLAWGLISCAFNSWLFGNPTGLPRLMVRYQALRNGQQALQRLEAGSACELVAGALDPRPLARAIAVDQFGMDMDLRDRLQRHLAAEQQELNERIDAANPVERQIYANSDSILRRQEQDGSDLNGAVARLRASSDYRKEARSMARESKTSGIEEAFPVFVSICTLVFWTSIWLLSALVFRGGLSYTLMGLSLVRSDGRLAGHFQSAWRVFLVWVPPALLLAAATLLDWRYWSVLSASARPGWIPWLTGLLRWTAMGLIVAYPVLAILSPRRTVHDWLAGTYVLPR
jgi:eukaryotic-like serine/threonine-protein kinase